MQTRSQLVHGSSNYVVISNDYNDNLLSRIIFDNEAKHLSDEQRLRVGQVTEAVLVFEMNRGRPSRYKQKGEQQVYCIIRWADGRVYYEYTDAQGTRWTGSELDWYLLSQFVDGRFIWVTEAEQPKSKLHTTLEGDPVTSAANCPDNAAGCFCRGEGCEKAKSNKEQAKWADPNHGPNNPHKPQPS